MAAFPNARGRHPFHMHDMIGSQPTRVEEAIQRVRASDFGSSLARARHLVLTGCGTSFHAAMYGARVLQAAVAVWCRANLEALCSEPPIEEVDDPWLVLDY